MARDHRTLRVFQESHQLALAIYKHTKNFPKEEWYGLRAQMRRATVSIATNIVEGSAWRTTREYLNFLNIARPGAGPQLEALVESVAQLLAAERKAKRAKAARVITLKA